MNADMKREMVSGMLVSSLIRAVRDGDVMRVAVALESGAPANATAVGGLTALMLASGMESGAGCVELLLAAGADVNKRDAKGMTALLHAARGGGHSAARTVTMLLAAGADARACSSDGSDVWSVSRMSGAPGVSGPLTRWFEAKARGGSARARPGI